MNKDERKAEKWIEDMAGVFTDPLIVYAGGWEDAVPEKLREAVTVERLIECSVSAKENRKPTATDAECLIYTYTVSMCQPLAHEWAQIHLYLGTRFVERDGRKIPHDIRADALTEYEKGLLNHLRRWIYDQRIKARSSRGKAEEKPGKAGVKPVEPLPQLQLF